MISKFATIGWLLATIAAPAIASAAVPTMESAVNLSGLEFNSGTLPGRPNWDYAVPSSSELDYYRSKGVNVIRLPLLWERLQPGLLNASINAALDPTYLALVRAIITAAAARKMFIIIDIHNYGGYGSHKIGDGTLTNTMFADFWKRLASSLQGSTGLFGYDLMNEPSNMPSTVAWPLAAQAAVNAIRRVDKVAIICVEGDNWASAGSWTSSNNNLNVSDNTGRLLYEAHVYGDHDNSGTHFSWVAESALGVTTQTIASRVAVFSNWCKTRNVGCLIGEVGVGNDNAQWNVELANGLAAMKSGGMMMFSYWAGGPWWGNYPMSIEPTVQGDAPQMSIVKQYAN